MKKYLFMSPVLKFIGEGGLFGNVFASVLRVLTILLALGAVVAWIGFWKLVFNMEGAALLGGVLFQVLFVLAVYMIAHTIWIRAQDIETLGRSEFTVIPIVSILLKLAGEIYACVSISVGVALGALTLFAGYNELGRAVFGIGLPGMGVVQMLGGIFGAGASSFVSAVLLVLGGALGAVFWLVVFYLASEAIIVIVDIARNTRALRETSERLVLAASASQSVQEEFAEPASDS
jgi:hypothetical protein